jgi:modulator of FtsH protease HflC
MNQTMRVGLAIGGAVVAVLLFSSLFVVNQTEQALVLRFGQVARAPIEAPGLYLKAPFIDTVILLDKRILDLDLPPQEVIASDQKRLVVDAFTRFRITDPLRFYQSVNSISGATPRLSSIVNSTVRSVVADATLTAVVRSERSALMNRIRDEVNRQAQGLGIQVVDVRLRRADLPEQNSQAVFQRMQTERQREAADIRAQGSELSQTIRARADRDVTVLRAEATRESEKLRGAGDAEKVRVLAEAFQRDPEFFSFFRSMQAYDSALQPEDTRLVLSPDSISSAISAVRPAGRRRSRIGPRRTPPPACARERQAALSDLLAAVGLALALEGILFAAFPAFVRRRMQQALELADGPLRAAGLMTAVVGVGVVFIVRQALG